MDKDEFRDWSLKAAEWGASYRETIRQRPVRAQTAPGGIAGKIALSPPEQAESMEAIFADFQEKIVPGMT
ncbi:MAG: aspartate aminotransferase family protein, partial [Rhizobiaceae bacterium]